MWIMMMMNKQVHKRRRGRKRVGFKVIVGGAPDTSDDDYGEINIKRQKEFRFVLIYIDRG